MISVILSLALATMLLGSIWWRFPWDQAAILTLLALVIGGLKNDIDQTKEFYAQVVQALEVKFGPDSTPRNPPAPRPPRGRVH